MESQERSFAMLVSRSVKLAAGLVLALAIGGCEDTRRSSGSRHYVPLSGELLSLMAQKNVDKHDPVLIRSYKKEAELEVWKRGKDGRYVHLKTFPICRWSGQLGPKIREGDRQAPEGFYSIAPAQMNPNSNFYLSFDMGFPNSYDRGFGRSGSFLMVHGACSSRGCYSMTDEQIKEIYALVREAHSGGQKAVQMQALPFRMTAENLAKHRYDPHMPFWKNLKEGADHFEVTKQEPKVAVCSQRYAFNVGDGCNASETPEEVRQAVAEKQRADNQKVAELVSKGTPALRVQYADGGQHISFRGTALAYAGGQGDERAVSTAFANVSSGPAEVSRPEALDQEPALIPLGPDGKPLKQTPKPTATAVASASPAPSSAPVTAVTRQQAAQPAKPQVQPQSAAQPAVQAQVEPPQDKSSGGFGGFFGRMFGGSSREEKATEPATPMPATAPLPPSRAAGQPAPRPQPQAAKPGDPQRTSALPQAITGSAPILPAGMMSYARLNQ